jgi:3',5'-cyclic AMP phosphodiesterase CpdA
MRLAHISDLHLLDLKDVPAVRFFNKRATGYANLRFKRNHVHRHGYVERVAHAIADAKVDHVAITGDLTNLALESEFTFARHVLDDDLRMPPGDVSVVPGNHDVYTRGAARSRRFAAYVGPYASSDLPEFGVEVGPGRFPFVRLRQNLAIIGLSSAVPRLPLVASGKLGRAQLGALRKILAHPSVKERTPVVLLHHPPHNPESKLKIWMGGLVDADELLDVLAPLPHVLVLHGHLHTRIQRRDRTDGGLRVTAGATSASLHHDDVSRMSGFNVYDFDDAGEVREVVAHVFDPKTEGFVPRTIPRWV